MPAAEADNALTPALPVPADALPTLFQPFLAFQRILLAVSGGPDSTALLLLAARWRAALDEGPALFVATVDHGLRPEARQEAEAVGALTATLGLPHQVLYWDGTAARSGLQEAARQARYTLLAAQARSLGAEAIVTAHTCDDQGETVLFRLIRGSGLSGLAGIPASRDLDELTLLRPLLGLRKAELVATCREAGIGFAEDPSNRNPRFARVRLRALMPQLEAEGLDAPGLSRLAGRMARADAALEAGVEAALPRVLMGDWQARASLRFDRPAFLALPEEIGLRLLGRAMGAAGDEGPVELAKLEALHGWLRALGTEASGARTLAGALLRVSPRALLVRPAPPRRG